MLVICLLFQKKKLFTILEIIAHDPFLLAEKLA